MKTPISGAAAPPLVIALALCGCGETSEPRVRIELEVLARGQSRSFETEKGWSVELHAATLHLETLRFFEGDLAAARGGLRFELVRSAWAHPGHYTPGEALADVITPVDLDLVAPEPARLRGGGVSGHFALAELRLRPSAGLGGRSAEVRGRADKGGRSVHFSASTDLDHTVRGIPLDVSTAGPLRLGLRVDLAQWLGRVDFDALPTSTSAFGLEPGSQGHNAFLRGVSSTAAYLLEEESNP